MDALLSCGLVTLTASVPAAAEVLILQSAVGLPGVAGAHVLWPAPCQVVRGVAPALHVVHELWPSLAVYLPAGHGVHEAAATLAYLPAGHEAHWTAPSLLPYLPSGHVRQSLEVPELG